MAFRFPNLTSTDGSVTITQTTSNTNLSALQNANLPAFTAFRTGNLSDVTGDGTVYTVIFNTTLLNQGSVFNTGTGAFTAPVTGLYDLSCNITMSGLLVGHTSARVNIIAGGQTTTIYNGNPFVNAVSGVLTISGGITIPMTAATTATVTVQVSGSTLTVDLLQFFTTGTNFSGFLVA